MGILIGIDVGTTALKAIAVSPEGAVVASRLVEYPLDTPRPGWAEQSADLWWDAAVRAVRGLLDGGVDAGSVAGVGLSGQMHGLVPMDASDRPLRPAILWCDQRTTAECEWLAANVGAEMARVACNPPLTGFTAPKILWLKSNEPRNYDAMKYFLLPKDYIRLRLTGERATDISDAAGTVALDVEKGRCADSLIANMGLRGDIFPRITGSGEVSGRVTAGAAAATGLREGTPVAGGGSDNTCAAVGNGIVRAGRVSSSIGSSGVVFAHTDALALDPGMRVHTFNHSVPGRFYLMGVMLSAGLSFRWFRDTFGAAERAAETGGGRDAYDALTALAAEAPPGCEGLLFLPYLQGERTPHKDPFARGAFFGISLRHERSHLARALMEGITFGLKDSLDIISSLGAPVSEIRATGGGGKSEFWRRMQADVFGAPVARVNHDEGPAFGAALLAGTAAGVYTDIAEAAESAIEVVSVVEPNAANTEIYARRHGRFRELYAALKEQFGALASDVMG